MATDPDAGRAECGEADRDCRADSSSADYENVRAADLANKAVVGHEEGLVPAALALLLLGDIEAAKKVEDSRHDVFRDRYRVHASGVREDDVAREHLRVQRASDAGGGRVH